ncbi:MAG: hypothetical protein ABII12_10350 [Planctomycetota bacterium]
MTARGISGDRGKALRRAGVPAALFLAALWLAWPIHDDVSPRVWSDSPSYVRWPAADPPIEGLRVIGPRPPVYPLLLKLTGDGAALCYVQTVLSVACWCFFGWAIFGTPGVVFGAVLANFPVVWLWNHTLLSESLSFSLLAASFGAIGLLAKKSTRRRLILASCVLAAFAFTRDSNIFLLPVLVLPCLLVRLKASWPLACVALVVFATGFISARLSNRWQWGHANAITARILPDAQAVAFFSEAGMPTDDAVLRQAGKCTSGPLVEIFHACPEFFDWLEEKGARTYAGWLVFRKASYVEPWRFLQQITDFDAGWYAKQGSAKRDFLRLSSRSYTWAPPPTFCTLFLMLAVVGYLIRGPARFAGVMTFTLVVATYTQALVTYHGDAGEVERHMVPALILYRMTVISALFLLFHVCGHFLRRRSATEASRGAGTPKSDGGPPVAGPHRRLDGSKGGVGVSSAESPAGRLCHTTLC